jgi:hypothetical protein
MNHLVLDVKEWAEQQFGDCDLGDERRTKRLVKFAAQVAAQPDASTPDQTEKWGDCKAAYRLMGNEDVSFQKIIEPHCRLTRARSGGTWLVINDTTEVSIPIWREVPGLGPLGDGVGRGFLLHTAILVGADSDELAGIAAQELFLRKAKPDKRESSAQRKRRARESEVWCRIINAVGQPPSGATFIDVCDRGADNIEVYAHALVQGHEWVIRAAQLSRVIYPMDPRLTDDPAAAESRQVKAFLAQLPVCGEYDLWVRANHKQRARTARLAVSFGEVWMPIPRHASDWTRQHAPKFIRMGVVQVREVRPPRGQPPLQWVLYTSLPVRSFDDAWRVVQYYEKRPLVEEYHKALKTGCSVEKRQYATSERLERVIGLLSVMAIRLVQLKTIARVEPDRPASAVVPHDWLVTLDAYRRRESPKWATKWPPGSLTVHEYFRNLAMLGGFLGRKCDGQPGWITIWRGVTKLLLILRGVRMARQKCG